MARRNGDIRARLLATFRVEAEEHLQAIAANLSALERGLPPAEAREVVEAAFREMHTLKGAARSVGLMEVEAVCQACESLLSGIAHGGLALSRAITALLQEAADRVAGLLAGGGGPADAGDLIGRLERAAVAPAAEARAPVDIPEAHPPAGAPGPAPQPSGIIRVPAARLDALLLRAEDLLVPKLAAGERLREIRGIAEALSGCLAALKGIPLASDRPAAGSGPAGLEGALRGVTAQAREMLAHATRDQRTIAGAVDGLLDEMRRMRMTPASTVLDLFPRMVRELAREQGKEVEWEAQGAELEVDRKVLEAMKEPLIHLVRNAVDHGIEKPEARAQAGKPRRGRVAAAVQPLEGGRVEIRLEDDGRGIGLERVKEEAVRARLLTAEEAQALSDETALDLVFRSGLSTSPLITDVSGHGLGLAIVKEQVERLDGRISVETRPGEGTTVRLVLPATIATFRGLLVRAGGQPFLLPLEAVERVIRVGSAQMESVEGRQMVRWNGFPLPVGRLDALLGLPERGDPSGFESGMRPCVVAKAGEERAGLLVDEILGDREGLVKELRPPLARVRNVAGAGLLGTGQLVLILRPADLLRAMQRAPSAAPAAGPEEETRQMAILVVDDSITTRTMEKNLLEAAGYRVRVAADGLEGWTALKEEDFDLVVSDVDMPRMDGFDLTARIRADQKLAGLPVVLVTALERREDKERGIEVGANAYIIKSSFDQSNLLEIIRRLV